MLHHHTVTMTATVNSDATSPVGGLYVSETRMCTCFLPRSTLVSKQPESMLAHMFRDKGDASLKMQPVS